MALQYPLPEVPECLFPKLRKRIYTTLYLSVDEDDRAEEPPGAALPVDVEHAQDLEEADAADGRGGEHLPVRTHGQHHDRRRHHDQVCEGRKECS